MSLRLWINVRIAVVAVAVTIMAVENLHPWMENSGAESQTAMSVHLCIRNASSCGV